MEKGSGADTERGIQWLRRLVVAMTAGLFLLMILTLVLIVLKAADETGDERVVEPYLSEFALRAGERIDDVDVERGRMYILIERDSDAGARIVTIDVSTGRVIGVVEIGSR